MDPITLALATFGIQKLRGRSTKRSFRDALIAGGIGQLGSMTRMGQQAGKFQALAQELVNLERTGTIAGAAGAMTQPLTIGQQVQQVLP